MISGRKVAIIGLGYVGLPLLMTLSRSNWIVLGIDSDEDKVVGLKSGLSRVEDVDSHQLREIQDSGIVSLSSSLDGVKDADVVVFCLPTPIKNNQPDLRILLDAVDNYAPFFKDEVLIVSESSSYPGTLREKIVPICEKYRLNKTFYYGHSPERVDPGNKVWTNENTPRIISGLDEVSLEKMREFYGSFCQELVEVDTPEIAEAAKMFENSFRQVNIALVNEFSRYCHHVGIPAQKVINAAATKPFGFMKFNYGAGVGGHCIPVDPYYLLDHAQRNGTNIELIEMSNKINTDQPKYLIERAREILGEKFDTSQIIVVGLSYKPNTSDTRESPGMALLKLLREEGLTPNWLDPMCKEEVDAPQGITTKEYDLAIITTLHATYDYTEILENCRLILDCTQTLVTTNNVIPL